MLVSGHTIGSAISENAVLHANLMAPSFLELEVWATKVYIGEIGIFYLFCSCDFDLHIQT